MRIAFTFARRELRGRGRGLWIVLACLALGVAAIAAVGSLRASIDRGLVEQGRSLLGGDLAVESGPTPVPAAVSAMLRGVGARLSDVVTMRSLLVATSGDRMLVELKAVDGRYPLVGATTLAPAGGLPATLAVRDGLPGLVAQQVVLDRLALHPGDRVRLGSATFAVRAALVEEPDRSAGPMLLAPRVMIALAALPATGLVQPGSLLNYAERAVLPPQADVAGVEHRLLDAFAGQGLHVRDAHEAAPGVKRFVDQTGQFMTLVGLTSLLVGGIGIATGVRAWLEARARTIATLRCLGAPSSTVFATFLIQVAVLSGIGILVGLAVGAALPALAVRLLGDLLPVSPRVAIYPGPLALAAAFGVLIAAAFSLWPLGRAARIPGGALFREGLAPSGARPGPVLILVNVALAAGLVALTVLSSRDRGFALYFCLAAAATLLVFRVGGSGLMLAARHLGVPGSAALRLGVANLHRPGASTPLMMVSLGLGLATLAAVALIEGNLRGTVLQELPARAPTFFFIDIQPDQLDRFDALLRAIPGVGVVEHVPNLRARVVAVSGVPAEQVRATPSTRWALSGDRGLTYAATPPEGTHIVAGRWWPPDYAGKPLVSFDANLAAGWGVKLGDTITLNVLGRDVTLTIASLRDIAWKTLSLNYVMVASPGLLSAAPHSNIATVRTVASPAVQAAVLRRVTDALPNVTGIRVADVLAEVAELIGKLASALAATASFALVAGALVLAGTVAAGQRRRVMEAVVLKTLGATRRQIRTAWLVEFGAIGLAAGLVAALVGTAASYAVVRYVMDSEWTFLPGILAATVLGCIALMLLFGYAGTASALRARPARLLRSE